MGKFCHGTANINFNKELGMKFSNNLKLVVFAPVSAADKVRQAMHQAGAGNAGDYSHVSYSSPVLNRFTPGEDSDPAIGKPGEPRTVEEERIEVLCPKEKVDSVLAAVKKVHPYEEVAYDVFERIDK